MSKFLFCYGSNNPTQLKERLNHSVEPLIAFAEDYKRVYRGYSQRWNGGVATLIKKPGATTYGLAIEVTESDLKKLDQYEGVASGNYKRTTIPCFVDGSLEKAVAYVSLSREWNAPSTAYLKAIYKTVSTFWNVKSYSDFYNEE